MYTNTMKTKLLIFGVTGDLSRRKLLPALRTIVSSNLVPELHITGISRRQVDGQQLLAGYPELAPLTDFFTMDMTDPQEFLRLKQQVQLQPDEQLVVYLSVPPKAGTAITDALGEAGLNTPNVKILFEKPFGVDLASAQDMIARTGRHFDEAQLYRIDHYLAKEMAQNIIALRSGNALFSHIWNDSVIDAIDVIASESIDIEGRADFYEQTGALRDLVQGHLMQLLALSLMEIPRDFAWSDVPRLRLRALQQLQPASISTTVRGQYEGYKDEVANPDSQVETFVKVGLRTTDPTLKHIAISLVTGKALAEKKTQIRVHLRKKDAKQSGCIIFNIQPDEGIAIELFVKKPGLTREFARHQLSYRYPEQAVLPDAYEQVLVDAIAGHKNLFTSGDEVLESWRILQPLLDGWTQGEGQLVSYVKGTALETL